MPTDLLQLFNVCVPFSFNRLKLIRLELPVLIPYIFIGGGRQIAFLGPATGAVRIKAAVDEHWRTGRQSVGQMMSAGK